MGRSARSRGAALLLIAAAAVCACRAATLESVHWSSSNPKFIPGQGLLLYPQIGDKMDIVCPRVEVSAGGKEEFYKVHLVSKAQMESCTVNKADMPLLNCDKPDRDVKFTFKFQEFSPNLWGLEFLKGRDYYITSVSTGSLRGLDNTSGGVCWSRSMKLVLRVGQNASDPLPTLQESPTRFPPAPPKSKAKDSPAKGNTKDSGSGTGQSGPGGVPEPGLLVWVISSCAAALLLIVVVLSVLWRRRQRRTASNRQQQLQQQSAAVSLSTLAVPKRDSVGSDNGSDRSNVVFPLRPSDSMICRHYERVSGEYGAPVYIVQEIMPQSPTNIYYKV
ncbi:ephrin-B2a-like [Kryptolebias marmoratus]|uniref:ephrin-B2a-like n=1 Tax=Kryptolebias marmoratus TaxID=37003 RepID=UPI0007F9366D|nr:ephrin-B2a-like [Kryptolebias marmoratus]